VRCGDPSDLVGEVPAGTVDRRHLQVLRIGIGHLPVAGHDLALDLLEGQQRLPRERVHAIDQLAQPARDDEVLAVLLERLHRRRRARARARSDHLSDALARDVGFCSEPESANSHQVVQYPRATPTTLNHTGRRSMPAAALMWSTDGERPPRQTRSTTDDAPIIGA
jgi:hypothetical protein